MITFTKKRLVLGLAVTAAVAAASVGGPAKADPQQYNAPFAGYGSDTVQDVLNALSGFTNGVNYTPIQSSAATGGRQLISYDAVNATNPVHGCISPKINLPTFPRPNGSSEGRRAVSRAIDGTKYGLNPNTTGQCNNLVDVSGVVDFARSSAGPAAGDLGTDLTYVPFGRDGVSFAYYQANPTAGAPTVTSLTRAQLTTLFTTGPTTIGTTRIVPCGIQAGSGTFTFWNGVTTATAAQEVTATTLCNGLIANTLGGRAEENDGNALKARGDAIAATAGETNTEVIIGFSAASYAAKSNNVAPAAGTTLIGIGSISNDGAGNNLGSPLTGAAPNFVPNATFYGNGVFGRNVYTVWPTSTLTGITADPAAIDLVVGSTSKLCAASATIQVFGFSSLGANCGTTATKGSLIAGQI